MFNCFFKMAVFYIEYFDYMKDYFHPDVATFIDHYTDDNELVQLPAFHGCGLENRNGTKKLVNYSNGDRCICGVWSDGNSKIEYGTFPMTRYMTQGRFRYIYKNKGNCLWNYKTKNMYIC